MEKPYSQKEISYFLGISQQLLCDFKKGRRWISKKSAIRISRIIGVGIADLFAMNWEDFLAAVLEAMEREGA